MNCLIVDDNRGDRLALRKICESVTFIDDIQDSGDPVHALQIIRKSPIDLLLLDVEMPVLNGLDFLKIDNSPIVILISGKSEYAINAFDFDVLDYVLKPISPVRILRALDKANHLSLTQHSENIVNSDSIFIREKGVLIKIEMSTILFFHSLGDYISIVTSTKRYVVRLTLKSLEGKVSSSYFVRVHRSYIIALNRVQSVEDNLIMLENQPIPLGDMYRVDFLARLNLV